MLFSHPLWALSPYPDEWGSKINIHSVAVPGSGAFLTPGSGIRDG